MTKNQAIRYGEEQLCIFGGEHKEFIKFAINCFKTCDAHMDDVYSRGYKAGFTDGMNKAKEKDNGDST